MREPKIVSLDDLNKAVEIKLGGKSFIISRLTMRITELYGEYLIFCGEYAKQVNATKLLSDDSSIDLPGLEKLDADMQKLVEDFSIGKAERIEEMLKTILEKNGHEFDLEWWHENARYQDMEQFIFQALKKDEDEAPKKKQAES
jgi:hypothetical protein